MWRFPRFRVNQRFCGLLCGAARWPWAGCRAYQALRIAPDVFVIWVTWCFKSKVAGGGPAATYFLLGGQEKVSKEKAALVRRPLTGVPCVTQRIWRLRNSPLPLRGKGSDSPRRHPQIRLRYSASHKGLRPRNETGLKVSPAPGFSFPLRAAEQHSPVGGSRRALSEPSLARASCAAARRGEQRRGVRRTGEPGAGFFWLLFLTVQEK